MSHRSSAAALHPPRAKPGVEGSISVRVRYCECDPMGVAHHAAYAPWLEMARTELLRESGVSYKDMEAAGAFLVITRLELRYRRPVRYDDVVEIHARVVGGSRVKIEHEYEITLRERSGAPSAAATGEVLSVGSTTLACVGRDGRICPLPEWLVPA